ncbi:MAG: agmatine deiminase family protein, partial [bacterium]
MPAEWEPHEVTWIAWPHKEESWPGNFAPIPAIWAQMAKHLSKGEKVHILVRDAAMEADARRVLRAHGAASPNIQFHHVPTNDSWMRDAGPIFLKNRDARKPHLILDWGYNAWGGKYPPFDLDDVIPQRIAKILGLSFLQPGIVLEGGSIDVNG